jgi:hypothetical protein
LAVLFAESGPLKIHSQTSLAVPPFLCTGGSRGGNSSLPAPVCQPHPRNIVAQESATSLISLDTQSRDLYYLHTTIGHGRFLPANDRSGVRRDQIMADKSCCSPHGHGGQGEKAAANSLRLTAACPGREYACHQEASVQNKANFDRAESTVRAWWERVYGDSVRHAGTAKQSQLAPLGTGPIASAAGTLTGLSVPVYCRTIP